MSNAADKINILEFDLTNASDVARLFPTLTAEEIQELADKMRVEFRSIFRASWSNDLRLVCPPQQGTRQTTKSPL